MKCVVCSVGDTARLMPSIWRSAQSSACWLSAGNPVLSEVRSRSGVSAAGSLEVRSWGSSKRFRRFRCVGVLNFHESVG